MPDQCTAYALRVRGRKGQRIRDLFLRSHPLCAHCLAQGYPRAATEVDHIIALANGGTDTWDNRQSLCAECHRTKTNADLGYRTRTACDINGYPTDESHPWANRAAAS